MRTFLALALAAAALALATSAPIDISYQLKVSNAVDSTISTLYGALNDPPTWTSARLTLALPETTTSDGHYLDATDGAGWFGVNVPGDWLSMAEGNDIYWGNLNSLTKWAPGATYQIAGGRYEVIPQRDNFTAPGSALDYFLMINRPADPKMLRYRLNFGPDGSPTWYWFGTGTQYYEGAEMTGALDVQNGHSFPVLENGDAISFVVRVPQAQMVEFAGQSIKSAFKIGGSHIEQVMPIPPVDSAVEAPAPSEAPEASR
jgi:hypothetical protein